MHAEQVFREIERTLKPGGAHIFTVPLVRKEKPTSKKADIDNSGQIIYQNLFIMAIQLVAKEV
jgi:ubiquinone/menaquinone biosynthesis C-methylase UbiE